MNNSSEQQVGVLSSLVIRNLLFLTSALVFLLWLFPTKLLAVITYCENCDCTDSANDSPGAICSDNVICSENPDVVRQDTIISNDQCPNKFPTVFNEANLTGQVGWSKVLATSVGTSIGPNLVCHSESATIPCVGPPVITGSRTPNYTYCCQPPPPPPPPQCCPYSITQGCVPCTSPVLIDTNGSGFDLTSAQNGVAFDITGGGHAVQIAWTAPGAQDAFLCLPDSKGACDDGRDLFGNMTPQPASSTLNGFAALAVYDDPKNGGDGDGIIDARDPIFSSLRLWIDANHDGISQPNEIFTLPQLGIASISLTYKRDERTDQYGNVFRYRAKVVSTSGAEHWAYDVFFATVSTTSKNACPVPAVKAAKADGK